MAEYTDREAFIPYRKADVIELCVEDGKLDAKGQQKFRELCEILSAYYHFECHEMLENLKNNFAPFNPDADTKPRHEPSDEEKRGMQKNLIEELGKVLQRANYSQLSGEALEKALDEESLITLNLDVNFDDFDDWVFYHRGSSQETVQVKKGLFKKVDYTMDIYERVVLLIKFKDEEYFKKKKVKIDKLNFTPGKMYVYMYKKIPQADIEVLFPNVEISMNWKDRLMLIGPAAAGGILTMVKVLPQLLLIAGLIIALLKADALAKMLGLQTEAGADVMKGVIGGLSGLGVFGGFIFKQYVKYKNKRIAFLKDVTDTLFFKNLDSNAGVFNTIVDAAEEEECKEVILAYYHLLTHGGDLTQEELDDKIENWLETKFDTKIDFDVDKALHKLENMKGKIVGDNDDEDSVPEVSLVTRKAGGSLHCLTIDESKTVVDYVWDNFFDYN